MNGKKFFLSMIITFLIATVVGGGLITANLLFGTNLPSQITQFLDKTTTDKANILLMGVDKDGLRADVIMVVSVDPERNKIDILSIPRDTRVQVSSGRYDKINHTLGYKSAEELVIKMVKQITGMPIHYYCEVDFEGFRDVIDILDGVEFDVPIDMHYDDPYQDLHIHVNKGLQVLDGAAAEGVVRYRATYATGDIGRIEVQQKFLQALFQQKLQPKYIRKAPALIKEIGEHVKTNFAAAQATKYVGMLKNLDGNSLNTHMLPGESQTIGNASYYVYNTTKTRELILTEFGYPEDEAAKLAQSTASAAAQ